MDDVIGILMWLGPLFVSVFGLNWLINKFSKRALPFKTIMLLSAIIVVLMPFITVASGYVDYQRFGLHWRYGAHVVQLVILLLISPLLLFILKAHQKKKVAFLSLVILNIPLVIIVNDLLVERLFVLPLHREYLLFELLGIQ